MTDPTTDRTTDRTTDPTTDPNRHPQAAADCAPEPPKTAGTRDAVDAAEQEVLSMMNEAKERLEPLDQWVRAAAAEHPYLMLCSAAGLSFVAGFLVRRRAALGVGVAVGFVAGCLLAASQTDGLIDSVATGEP